MIIGTWGKKPDGSDWNIGITNPFQDNELFTVVPLREGSVTTSGSYEKFVMFDGKRYSHIINPATGYPATGLCSVTVFGPGTETSNGFSTSLMVLGKDAGLKLIEQYPEYSCIMITDEGKVITSKNFHLKKLKSSKRTDIRLFMQNIMELVQLHLLYCFTDITMCNR